MYEQYTSIVIIGVLSPFFLSIYSHTFDSAKHVRAADMLVCSM